MSHWSDAGFPPNFVFPPNSLAPSSFPVIFLCNLLLTSRERNYKSLSFCEHFIWSLSSDWFCSAIPFTPRLSKWNHHHFLMKNYSTLYVNAYINSHLIRTGSECARFLLTRSSKNTCLTNPRSQRRST
ncbi:hypothetical protein BDN67DRAFT_62611 [Paxillus ammoniavirescens]|nr:hypothetical protein BDN67DRAFT_62611 [Paxillus ammoniavirescens]